LPKNKKIVKNNIQVFHANFIKGQHMPKLDKFQTWIKENTIKGISAKLKEDPVTVWKWFMRRRPPKPTTSLKIIRLSKLTWTDIYENYALGKRLTPRKTKKHKK
jgi:hypothetical protein